ncbi:MAG TPA: hypothetical protein VJ481_01560 [Patescibacteria group bacterium]|uniref:Uncharacterized protein n=1 Tax=Candidatus Woesebacteria bacterium RBG_13_46_13 TaxID=1802479 RepID=A0A1F7X3R1_9BACT|nr:MAG: hypothetical protein A2Y68_03775 [Candidatus Woesebacteria bacterium RBG_13_46_13]HJX59227.1 hypothetical protein [Patescibacteria group bacterium]
MDIDLVSKEQKKVIAKTLLDLNYSAIEIAEFLGINRSTVYRYGEQPTSKEMQHFATEIKTIFTVKQYRIIAKILARMEVLVERTFDLKGLIKAFNSLGKSIQTSRDINSNSED